MDLLLENLLRSLYNDKIEISDYTNEMLYVYKKFIEDELASRGKPEDTSLYEQYKQWCKN